MAISTKLVKLHPDVLLEWVYDSENLQTDDYQVVTDLTTSERGYMSKSGLNKKENTLFTIDPIVKKYAKVDISKYNYLKLENYSTSPIQFDKLRIYLPTTYSFSDNGYIGLRVKIYAYDYENKNIVQFSQYLYDDTAVGSMTDMQLNAEFYYDEQSWGKYLTYNIPSIDMVSKQRTSTVSSDLPITNSINANLTKANGLSLTAPIFVEFCFIVSTETILGNTYYYGSDLFTKSLSKTPEYLDLAAVIEEATDGDYFWIYGTYGGDNESMDNFIDELTAKGRSVKIEYELNLFEENVLMNTQKFVVEENFTKKMWYRPVLSFTNTTASIDLTMRVIDLVDNSQIERFASISLTSEVFKYGKILTRINMDNVFRPKIYNLKSSSGTQVLTSTQISDIDITKVNYPVIADRIDILASSSPSNSSAYKPMGLGEIIINPFGNVVKFKIAKKVDNRGNVTPYDLTDITQNAQMALSFKTDTDFLEKLVWQDTDQNDFEHGIIVFRIEQTDVTLLKKMLKSNNNFYITVNSDKTGTRSLFYSGKWYDFDKVVFVDTTGTIAAESYEFGDFTDLGLSTEQLQQVIQNTTNVGTTYQLQNINTNLIVFLDPDANITVFDNYLSGINADVYIKKPAGNSDSMTYLYFLTNVPPAVTEDIKVQPGVSEVSSVPLGLGLDQTGSNTTINVNQIRDSILGFNCQASQNS